MIATGPTPKEETPTDPEKALSDETASMSEQNVTPTITPKELVTRTAKRIKTKSMQEEIATRTKGNARDRADSHVPA